MLNWIPPWTMSPPRIVPNSWLDVPPAMVSVPELARCLSPFTHQLYVPFGSPDVMVKKRLASVWNVKVTGTPALHNTKVPVGDMLSGLGVAVGWMPCHVRC